MVADDVFSGPAACGHLPDHDVYTPLCHHRRSPPAFPSFNRLQAFVESLSTLKFANRAKSIKNEARINEDLDQKSLLRRYERELKQLRAELEERSRNVVDQRRLLELDEQRRRAEEDKMAAIRALEARSKEFMKEKAEKKRLEEKITSLQSQMLAGGGTGVASGQWAEVPAFKNALKEHQERIRAEYDNRLAELEKERETIEEEKAQVDRYKQLLLKQRDIMILLTQRLNERDEQIMALQDELDAYDRHQRDLEEKLDEKTAALIHLQRVTMEHDAVSPVRNSELAAALGAWAGKPPGRGGVDGGPIPAMQALDGAGAAGGSETHGASPSDPARHDGAAHAAASSSSASISSQSSMARALESLRSDRDRLARELEDVQAEKVSMEYLLRERLEKLVQTEIEARLLNMRQAKGGEGVAALELRLQKKQSEVDAAKEESARLREEVARAKSALEQAQRGSAASSTTAAAQARITVLEKERAAISAIMEGKICKLVDSVCSAIAGSSAQQGAKWVRELTALQRLVHASVAALQQGPQGGEGGGEGGE